MKEVVIGFLGCGNVGGGVWSLLTGFSREIAHRDSLSIRIKRVLVRDVNKTRACGVPHELLTTNADDVVSDPEISIVVEFMGGEQPATDYMLRALENGKTIIDGENVFVNVMDADLREAEGAAFEYHRRYADLQINLTGSEHWGWASEGKDEGAFDEAADCGFKSGAEHAGGVLGGGRFAIFFPGELHKPGVARPGCAHVRTVVIKIRMED